MAGTQFGDLPVDPAAAWTALSFGGKAQILGFIGFLEFHSELTKPHVTKGGVPGEVCCVRVAMGLRVRSLERFQPFYLL
jgi:hypothetical protein